MIVKDNRVVGCGWHRKAGTPHAEVHALNQARELAQGADVYVTLVTAPIIMAKHHHVLKL